MLTASRVLDGIEPRAFESPADEAAVSALMREACAQGLAVTPLGGGTMMEFGNPLERADLVLSTERQDHILDHQPANLTVHVEAGVTLASLNRALAERGQYLPLDPPCAERATIGGIVAANASGPLRVRFGTARDMLLGIHVALADGNVVHGGGQVVKNVAGYDMPKLFIGALGTLGVITQAIFKLQPLPARTRTALAAFDAFESACTVAARLAHSPLLPHGVEILNASAAAGIGLLEHVTLAVRFGGILPAIEREVNDLERWAREQGARTFDAVPDDAELWGRVRDAMDQHGTVLQIGVLPTDLPAIEKQAAEVAGLHDLICAVQARSIGTLLVAFDGESDALAEAIPALRAAAVARGGYLIIQRGARALRERVGAWGEPRDDIETMRRIKTEFDPRHILNPGRFIGGI